MTETLGERIRRLRLARGLSQLLLADFIERPQQALSSWETGEYAPDAHTLDRIAEELQVDPEEFHQCPR